MKTTPRRKPAYLVISDALRERIERQELLPGDRFPTERELVQEFGVARMTVRHALDILQLEGLIDRRRGRTGGTFVRAIPPVAHLDELDSIDKQLVDRGHEIHTHVINVEKKPVPRHIAPLLELEEGELVWVVDRVRGFEGNPMSLTSHYIVVAQFPELPHLDLSKPICVNPVFKREMITPVMPTPEQQERLGVTRLQPLLRLARTVWDDNGQVIGFAEEFVRTETLGVSVDVGTAPASRPDLVRQHAASQTTGTTVTPPSGSLEEAGAAGAGAVAAIAPEPDPESVDGN